MGTVADLLGIHLDTEPPVYQIGSEPAPAPRPRPPRRRAPALDRRRVVPFYAAAQAGVPDADIARAAGVTRSQVKHWRLRLGIKRRGGTSRVARIHGALLDAPELAALLRAFAREEARDPTPMPRFGYAEIAPLLAARGLRLDGRDARPTTGDAAA